MESFYLESLNLLNKDLKYIPTVEFPALKKDTTGIPFSYLYAALKAYIDTFITQKAFEEKMRELIPNCPSAD